MRLLEGFFKMEKIVTVSVGIPAHNEGNNIGNVIKSIQSQLPHTYKLINIFVISDNSTDSTNKIVESFTDERIVLIKNITQKGKTYAIKKLFSLSQQNKSDFLILLDADLTIKDKKLLQKMVNGISKDDSIIASSGFALPKDPQNFIQRIGYYGFYIWEDMIKRSKSTLYYRSSDPLIIFRVSDFLTDEINSYTYLHDEFYFLYALKLKKKFTFIKNAHVYFTLPSTTADYLKQMRRYIGNHLDSDEVYSYVPYKFTLKDRIISFYRTSNIHILSAIAYTLIQLYLHIESLIHTTSVNGTWERVDSTK